jgi:hypothetical protein
MNETMPLKGPAVAPRHDPQQMELEFDIEDSPPRYKYGYGFEYANGTSVEDDVDKRRWSVLEKLDRRYHLSVVVSVIIRLYQGDN